jgi:hypothetical protein
MRFFAGKFKGHESIWLSSLAKATREPRRKKPLSKHKKNRVQEKNFKEEEKREERERERERERPVTVTPPMKVPKKMAVLSTEPEACSAK